MYNAVDLERFKLRRTPLQWPPRALLFSHYASESTYLPVVREACQSMGIALDVRGLASGNVVKDPENLLLNYDLVFAKGRCALEAIAVGNAVVLCGQEGAGPMVTTQELAQLRRLNFGRRTLVYPLQSEIIAQQITRLNPEDAAAVSQQIHTLANLDSLIEQLIDLYEKVISEYNSNLSPTSPTKSSLLTEQQAVAVYIRSLGSCLAKSFLWERKCLQEEQEAKILQEMLISRPIPSEDDKMLQFKAKDIPTAVTYGQSFSFQVELENQSSWILNSNPPYPICFAYHWKRSDTNEIVIYEGLRSKIHPPLLPHNQYSYTITVVPPQESIGNYILQLTLVQEHVRWFEGGHLCQEFPISVVSSPISKLTPHAQK